MKGYKCLVSKILKRPFLEAGKLWWVKASFLTLCTKFSVIQVQLIYDDSLLTCQVSLHRIISGNRKVVKEGAGQKIGLVSLAGPQACFALCMWHGWGQEIGRITPARRIGCCFRHVPVLICVRGPDMVDKTEAPY